MKTEIKNRYTSDIILSGEYESTKECIELNKNSSNLSDADLSYANLNNANLSYANLNKADLKGTTINGETLTKQPIQIIGLKYFVLITKEQIKIGCKQYPLEKWKNFSDEEISKMDEGALEWWKENKDFIFMCHEKHKKGGK